MTFFVKRSELLLFKVSDLAIIVLIIIIIIPVYSWSQITPVDRYFDLWLNQDNHLCVWRGGRVSWSSVPLLPAFTLPYNPELQTASTCPRYICLELPEWENVHSTPQSWTHIRAVRSVYTEEPNWTWANVGSEGYAAMNGKLRHTLT